MTILFWLVFAFVTLRLALILWVAGHAHFRFGDDPYTAVVGTWSVFAVAHLCAELAAYVLAPFAVLFARSAGVRVLDQGGGPGIRAYRVPRWLRWLETHDDHDGLLPGGLYEPTVRRIYQRLGWRVASLYWLWRNTAYRYRATMAVAIPGRFEHENGWEVTDTTNRTGRWIVIQDPLDSAIAFEWRRQYGPIELRAGWKLADLTDGDGQVGKATGILQPPSLRLRP